MLEEILFNISTFPMPHSLNISSIPLTCASTHSFILPYLMPSKSRTLNPNEILLFLSSLISRDLLTGEHDF